MEIFYCPLYRRDKELKKHSRVYSYHFKDGKKSKGPENFERNKDKLFFKRRGSPRKKIEKMLKEKTVVEIVEDAQRREPVSVLEWKVEKGKTTQEVILEAGLDLAKTDVQDLQEQVKYKSKCYTVSELPDNVIRMRTSLPTKKVFEIVVRHASRFNDSINYFRDWKVESIIFEEQIFITLLKVRRNYTNLSLAQLFNCSVATISSIITTFTHVVHSILFHDIMTSIPIQIKTN